MLGIMILDGALKNRDQLDIVEPSKHLPVQSQRWKPGFSISFLMVAGTLPHPPPPPTPHHWGGHMVLGDGGSN